MVLGVTGGIASGKTTVAHMLAELCAPIIDFDLLAREVVVPGQPAFQEIVGYFGEAVIGEDGNLDRKRLSGIVFQDPEKRRILEAMTHPRILEAFVRRVRQLGDDNPQGIVQAVIPLLFEAHLEPLVHKVLVVYVSPDTQIERLMKRDRISREEARRILDAQMPIDEKAARADFVIRNEGDVEGTRKQVTALWKRLKEMQNSQRKR
ncbi:MAG: dephospho-CoA kinase [Deltaproteobacteria bacterium]|nr:dephospho-CoA kinase [Deltaproteobacteria bacterium]